MVEYYIYEIKGVKVGCTTDMVRRQREQRSKGEMVVLETHTNIEDATRRERELQLEKGYSVDSNGYKTWMNTYHLKSRTKEVRKKAVNNTNWEERNKSLAKSRRGIVNIGLQKHNESIRVPVKAYNITHNGRKKQNFKILTKELIGTYESITAASKELKIPAGIIHNILNPNNRIFQVRGFMFEYA